MSMPLLEMASSLLKSSRHVAHDKDMLKGTLLCCSMHISAWQASLGDTASGSEQQGVSMASSSEQLASRGWTDRVSLQLLGKVCAQLCNHLQSMQSLHVTYDLFPICVMAGST